MNKEILLKIDEINEIIKNSPEYQKYLKLKTQISNNEKLKKLINEVRILQQDTVHHIEKSKELEEKTNELNNDPLYREYTNTLYEINNVYGIIESSLNNYFKNKLN